LSAPGPVRIVIAIHDPPVWTIPASEVDRIQRTLAGDEVVDARDEAARRRALPAAEVLFATRLSADEAALAERLRWIHSSAVGVGGLLPPAVVYGPVVVTNSRGVHSDAIAEHALALVLALRRNLHVAAARQAARQWAQLELAARRVGPLGRFELLVIGLGTIGSRVAALAAGLGMRVTGVRRRVREPTPPGVALVLPPGRLAEGLRAADAVVLAVPRTAETRTLIGRDELALMKPSALLVNVARGRLVDEDALVEALRSGRLAGAGLDAFAHEPLPPEHPFWGLPNVLVTPHTAAFGADYWPPTVDLFLENLARLRRGDPLRNVVDKAQGY
jgi:phosphoglycerate dehydrogenase-like enzyme